MILLRAFLVKHAHRLRSDKAKAEEYALFGSGTGTPGTPAVDPRDKTRQRNEEDATKKPEKYSPSKDRKAFLSQEALKPGSGATDDQKENARKYLRSKGFKGERLMGKPKLDFSELDNLDFSELDSPKAPAPKPAVAAPVPAPAAPTEPSFDEFSMLRDQAASRADSNTPTEKHTAFDTLNRAVGQGASYGFGDELSAAIDYGVSKIPGVRNVAQAVRTNLPGAVTPDIPLTDPTATYEQQRRDANRTANHEAMQAHPGVYMAGEIGGSLLAPGPKIPGKGLAKTVLFNGAGYGAVSGLGHSDADTAGGVITDTAEGGGLGAGTAAAESSSVQGLESLLQQASRK